MDPQQRLVLTSFFEAASASVMRDGKSLADQNVGIYIGSSQLDYAQHLKDARVPINAYYATGSHLSVAAGRIAYIFGTKGPAVVADTACSSSLSALHIAFLSVQSGESAMAAAGGVNLTLAHSWTIACQRAGMLSENGRCQALDSGADGYVRAEGSAMLMLAPLAAAAPEDVLAVVCGTALNQDGRSSSLTAPNGLSQQAVIRSALRAADRSIADVASLQTHGTGTALGDPIELGSLFAVAGAAVKESAGRVGKVTIAIQASKSLLGHAEPAAGGLALLHALHNVQQRSLIPILHLRTPNPHIVSSLSLQRGAVDVVAPRGPAPLQLPPWGAGEEELMLTGVSAFAFQGTNSHALLTAGPSITDAPDSFEDVAQTILRSSSVWISPLLSLSPLLRAVSVLPDSVSAVFEVDLTAPRAAMLWDHRVKGRVLFPAVGMMHLMASAVEALLFGRYGFLSSIFKLIGLFFILFVLSFCQPLSKNSCLYVDQLIVLTSTRPFTFLLVILLAVRTSPSYRISRSSPRSSCPNPPPLTHPPQPPSSASSSTWPPVQSPCSPMGTSMPSAQSSRPPSRLWPSWGGRGLRRPPAPLWPS